MLLLGLHRGDSQTSEDWDCYWLVETPVDVCGACLRLVPGQLIGYIWWYFWHWGCICVRSCSQWVDILPLDAVFVIFFGGIFPHIQLCLIKTVEYGPYIYIYIYPLWLVRSFIQWNAWLDEQITRWKYISYSHNVFKIFFKMLWKKNPRD